MKDVKVTGTGAVCKKWILPEYNMAILDQFLVDYSEKAINTFIKDEAEYHFAYIEPNETSVNLVTELCEGEWVIKMDLLDSLEFDFEDFKDDGDSKKLKEIRKGLRKVVSRIDEALESVKRT